MNQCVRILSPVLLAASLIAGCQAVSDQVPASVIGPDDYVGASSYSPQNIEFRLIRAFLWREGTTGARASEVIQLCRRLAALESNRIYVPNGRRDAEEMDRDALLREIASKVDLLDLAAEGITALELRYDFRGVPQVRELPSGRLAQSAVSGTSTGILDFALSVRDGTASMRILKSSGAEIQPGSPVFYQGDVELKGFSGANRRGFVQLHGVILPR